MFRRVGRVGVLLAGPLLLVIAIACMAAGQTPPPSDTKARLEEEKLREEILKLRREGSPSRLLPQYAAVVTALVGAGGLVFTGLKYIDERAKERAQRDTESLRRLEESFVAAVTNLGAEREAVQASAAVTLLTFLKPERDYVRFHEPLFLLTLAALKVERGEPVRRLLVRVLERAARLHVPAIRPEDRRLQLDLARIKLDRVDLSGLDLSEADLAFASLRHANLSGEDTVLRRVQGREVDLEEARLSRASLNEARLKGAHCSNALFHGSNLVAARLGEADLRGAQFNQAKLQGADFRGADLRGATFKGAVVSDADLRGASLDEAATRELMWTNWRETTKLDPELRARLEELSRRATVKESPARESIAPGNGNPPGPVAQDDGATPPEAPQS
ncbi:MAG: pentapeptide repeat-containing protein [Actinomycetota bacterium]